MNDDLRNNDHRLEQLGRQLADQPSVAERVMQRVAGTRPPQVSRFNHRRILVMLSKPRNLAAAAAVLALVVFGLRPWSAPQTKSAAWWLSPPAAWAGELQAAIEQAGQRGFTCQEKFINLVPGAKPSTSSTTGMLFAAGDRYRRDTYDEGRLRETQWYAHSPQGLKMTSVRYHDKTYSVTLDPKVAPEALDLNKQLDELTASLEKSGRRIGPAQIEGRDAVEFEIEKVHIWLDQATKMPLKITQQFEPGGGQIVAVILVMEQFDWHATLPAGTFTPEIPEGFTEVGSK